MKYFGSTEEEEPFSHVVPLGVKRELANDVFFFFTPNSCPTVKISSNPDEVVVSSWDFPQMFTDVLIKLLDYRTIRF